VNEGIIGMSQSLEYCDFSGLGKTGEPKPEFFQPFDRIALAATACMAKQSAEIYPGENPSLGPLWTDIRYNADQFQ
jgi:hypothetical protein